MNNTLDMHTTGQIADRLKSLFESARRYQQQRARSLVRSIKPRTFPEEHQLELELPLE